MEETFVHQGLSLAPMENPVCQMPVWKRGLLHMPRLFGGISASLSTGAEYKGHRSTDHAIEKRRDVGIEVCG